MVQMQIKYRSRIKIELILIVATAIVFTTAFAIAACAEAEVYPSLSSALAVQNNLLTKTDAANNSKFLEYVSQTISPDFLNRLTGSPTIQTILRREIILSNAQTSADRAARLGLEIKQKNGQLTGLMVEYRVGF